MKMWLSRRKRFVMISNRCEIGLTVVCSKLLGDVHFIERIGSKATATPSKSTSSALKEAVDAIYQLLDERSQSPTPIGRRTRSSTQLPSFPIIFLALDEAHPLTSITSTGAGERYSNFSMVRKILRMMQNSSSFSFFLSTTGK